MIVIKKTIKKGLREIGVRKGDLVMVHSSLSSFGYVEGGADTVIDALMEVVGEEGTILMPTFNPRVKIFDPLTTPSSVGKITEVFRKMKGVLRSIHPTHSYASWGKWAEYLIKDHKETHGIDSPLGKLARKGGYVLMLGAPPGSNTSIHIAETIERVHCMGFGERICWIRTEQGEIVEARSVLHREKGCPLFGEKIEEYLKERDKIKEMKIGKSRVRLMKSWDVIEAKRYMIYHGYKGIPPCSKCKIKPHSQEYYDNLPCEGEIEGG